MTSRVDLLHSGQNKISHVLTDLDGSLETSLRDDLDYNPLTFRIDKEARIVNGVPAWWYTLYVNNIKISEFD